MSTPNPVARLKFKSGVPHGGMFVLKMTDRGLVGSATSFSGLCREVRQWRVANGFPNGLGLTDEIETAVCEVYPNECETKDNRIPDRARRLSLARIMQGTIVMASHKLNGSVLVDSAEAERRASICVNCPNNVNFTKPCSNNCAELKTLVNAIVGARKTQYDDQLKACQICGCFLSASVWVPLEVQTPVLTAQQRIQFEYAAKTHGCWKIS